MTRCWCTSQNRDRDCPIHGDDRPRPPRRTKPLETDPKWYVPSECKCEGRRRHRDCPLHGIGRASPPRERKPLDTDPTSYDPKELEALPSCAEALGWYLKRDDGRTRVYLGPDEAVMTELLPPGGAGYCTHRVTPRRDGFYYVQYLRGSSDWEIGEFRDEELYVCGSEEPVDLKDYDVGPRIQIPDVGHEPWR